MICLSASRPGRPFPNFNACIHPSPSTQRRNVSPETDVGVQSALVPMWPPLVKSQPQRRARASLQSMKVPARWYPSHRSLIPKEVRNVVRDAAQTIASEALPRTFYHRMGLSWFEAEQEVLDLHAIFPSYLCFFFLLAGFFFGALFPLAGFFFCVLFPIARQGYGIP